MSLSLETCGHRASSKTSLLSGGHPVPAVGVGPCDRTVAVHVRGDRFELLAVLRRVSVEVEAVRRASVVQCGFFGHRTFPRLCSDAACDSRIGKSRHQIDAYRRSTRESAERRLRTLESDAVDRDVELLVVERHHARDRRDGGQRVVIRPREVGVHRRRRPAPTSSPTSRPCTGTASGCRDGSRCSKATSVASM